MYSRISFVIIFLFLIACNQTKKSEDSQPEAVHQQEQEKAEKDQSVSKPVLEPKAKMDTTEGKMVYFEGGTIKIGSDEGMPNERPVFETSVDPFYIDKYLVTVQDFKQFVQATGYITEAEKFGDAGVFSMEAGRWELVKGATWEYPLGPDKTKAKDDHPVTQVSWNDAVAYCTWKNKRLPTEIEWEYAARGGENNGNKYSWGNEIFQNDKFMANVWQGTLQDPQGADGFEYTSPVGYYGETEAGLTDMGGNVWEWCQSIYKPYPGGQPVQINRNVKVIRGGSFFYDEAGDLSYTVSFRGNNSVETSLFNTGFRCAKNGE